MTAKHETINESNSTPDERAMDIIVGDGLLVEVDELKQVGESGDLFLASGRVSYLDCTEAELVVNILTRRYVLTII
jgi:hypothetical protein